MSPSGNGEHAICPLSVVWVLESVKATAGSHVDVPVNALLQGRLNKRLIVMLKMPGRLTVAEV